MLSVALGLLIAEGAVRITNVDWRYARKLVPTNGAYVKIHKTDDNPLLLYRMNPGRYEYLNESENNSAVFINSHGYRSPERESVKPEGVFRVVCAGGSNVFGYGVKDEEAWPSRLEKVLRNNTDLDVEVWNIGTNGYVGCQMAIVLEESIELLDPDLIMVGLTNLNQPLFLQGEPIKPYYQSHPQLWLKTIPTHLFDFPESVSWKTKTWFVNKVHIYRFFLLALMEINGSAGNFISKEHEATNVRMVREFIQKQLPGRQVCIFLFPGISNESEHYNYDLYQPYFRSLNVPVFHLVADGLPPLFRDIHPPAHVYQWYAEQIAQWLEANDMLAKAN